MNRVALFALLFGFFASAFAEAKEPQPTNQPTIGKLTAEWQPLLGETLDGWQPFTGVPHKSVSVPGFPASESDDGKTGTAVGASDPLKIFQIETIDGKPTLHISGQVFAGLNTKQAYENYHLTLEYKWGKNKYPPRENSKRDSGILMHCNGKQGAFWNVWMQCLECQVQETDTADFIPLAGTSARIAIKADDQGSKPLHQTDGEMRTVGRGGKAYAATRRANHEIENDWNRVDVLTLGDKTIFAVNGHIVMRLNNTRIGDQNNGTPLTSGMIQLQSEAAEVYYRDIRIKQIDALPEGEMLPKDPIDKAAALPPTVQQGDQLVIQPRPAPGPLDNPLKGWCPYPNSNNVHQPFSMAFFYAAWKDLEPVEGQYAFDEWEKKWDTGHGKDKHVIFRVYIDYPKRPSGLPDWLAAKGVELRPSPGHGCPTTPYDDPRVVAGMERLIAALGERFNQHPRVAFVQLGLLGWWGEWHTYPNSDLYASQATEARVIDAYRRAFPDKSLMARTAERYAGRQPWLGFHDDSFPLDTDNGQGWSFLAKMRKSGRDENWRQAIIGGELVPGQSKKWLGKEYEFTKQMIERSHFSWVGPYCPGAAKVDAEDFSKRCQELVRQMGYSFRFTQLLLPATITSDQPFICSAEGTNDGVAPFYYPWQVEFALLDDENQVVSKVPTDWDIRTWQPDESFAETASLQFNASPGKYRVAIGIRDPWTNRPAIRFANELDVVDGWSVVSAVTVR